MLPQIVVPKALFIALLLASAFAGLSGCGNTGDLYLPEDAPVTQGNNTEKKES
ncbi:MAG: lipoprotein [Porticoccaceae bacterium]